MTTNKKTINPQKPSRKTQGVTQLSTRPKTRSGKVINELLINIWEPLDQLGKALIGDLWRDVYLTIQDAIGLGILYVIFGWIFHWITKENFTSFDQCWNTWSVWEVNRYFCLVVVLLAFSSCITLCGRILKRLLKDMINL
ncbi:MULTISPECIES: hypothetical protein [Moorena]|uniref:Uncharacterized protein n=1 Tax=Moorena producens 3L TaxID=489825 RepID=F4Y3E3_9CYAN|nr:MULTISPECIES: hypothetical protein [Moorena]EGJ28619.1 hypothetical protein LYNGBM3L_72280 [Moorena producens 3L]NEP64260.1 hypothetical protein [Moorena sp. SIO3A5]NEQ11038.1 hypothetical protein [Moorena sp. SIO4E2]NET66103.1 hypothetical protein [Moorena sp. SIO1G6]